MKVLVSHPHAAAVSVATASALERVGALARFVTGVTGAPGGVIQAIAAVRPELRNRVLDEIPTARVSSLAPVEVGARVAGSLLKWASGGRVRSYDALFVTHDWAVSFLPWDRHVDTVYAYEDAALKTFERSRRKGIRRVWDLPAPHWSTAERVWEAERRRWPDAAGAVQQSEPAWKKHRKERELELADVVSVASAHTRASLETWGVTKPIVVTPYGFPVHAFRPKSQPPAGPFTVLSVGTHDLRKGTPYLLEAWKWAGLRDACLRLVGPMRLRPEFLRRYEGLYEHVPHMPKAMLEPEYQRADLLAFPTLGDGFGLVIQEAMCCGTPVVTTLCSGGPECIRNGREGWIIPERDVEALATMFRAGAASRDDLFRMGQAARARAEAWTWKAAGERLVRALEG